MCAVGMRLGGRALGGIGLRGRGWVRGWWDWGEREKRVWRERVWREVGLEGSGGRGGYEYVGTGCEPLSRVGGLGFLGGLGAGVWSLSSLSLSLSLPLSLSVSPPLRLYLQWNEMWFSAFKLPVYTAHDDLIHDATRTLILVGRSWRGTFGAGC